MANSRVRGSRGADTTAVSRPAETEPVGIGTGQTRVRYVSHKPFRRFSMNTDEPRSRQRESDVDVSVGDAPVRSITEARQGVTGHNVRYVLGFGVLAVIIAFAVVYGYYFHA